MPCSPRDAGGWLTKTSWTAHRSVEEDVRVRHEVRKQSNLLFVFLSFSSEPRRTHFFAAAMVPCISRFRDVYPPFRECERSLAEAVFSSQAFLALCAYYYITGRVLALTAALVDLSVCLRALDLPCALMFNSTLRTCASVAAAPVPSAVFADRVAACGGVVRVRGRAAQEDVGSRHHTAAGIFSLGGRHLLSPAHVLCCGQTELCRCFFLLGVWLIGRK